MGIRAIWVRDNKRYVLVGDISKIVKKSGEIYLTIKELIKELSEMNTKFLEDISKAKVIYDPYRIISAIKEGIRRGLFVGSKETIVGKIIGIILRLRENEKLKEEILINAYMAATDALQAIVLKKTGKMVVPKHLADFVEKNLQEFIEASRCYRIILKAIKEMEHKKRIPSGKELDKIIRGAIEIFEEAEML